MTRRQALCVAPASFVAGFGGTAAIPADGPDALLIRLCGEHDALQTRWDALVRSRHSPADEARTDPALQALENETDHLAHRIIACRARTQAGIEARVRTLEHMLGELMDECLEGLLNRGGRDLQFIHAIVRDLVVMRSA